MNNSNIDENNNASDNSAVSDDNEKIIEQDNVNENVSKSQRGPISRRKMIWGTALSFVAIVPLSAGTAYFVAPMLKNNEAKKELVGLQDKQGSIMPMNTELTTFKGQKVDQSNVNQKALSKDKETKSAVFMFGNGKNVEQKIVDVYVDFNSQRSRDFLLINQLQFKSMIQNGLVEIHVHPVPTGSAFSMYSAEALAESCVSSPARSWDFMMGLLKLSANIDQTDKTDVLQQISETAKQHKIDKVNEESIKKGTFASWIVAVGDDKRLQTGYYPPIVYVNGNIVDPEKTDFNNPDDVRKEIMNKGNK